MGTLVMARPKKPGKKEKPQRILALTIRGTLEWRSWVERLAEHCRTDVAKLVDASLLSYAAEHGFDEPAPKR